MPALSTDRAPAIVGNRQLPPLRLADQRRPTKGTTMTDDDKAAIRDELELLGLTAEEIEELVR